MCVLSLNTLLGPYRPVVSPTSFRTLHRPHRVELHAALRLTGRTDGRAAMWKPWSERKYRGREECFSEEREADFNPRQC